MNFSKLKKLILSLFLISCVTTKNETVDLDGLDDKFPPDKLIALAIENGGKYITKTKSIIFSANNDYRKEIRILLRNKVFYLFESKSFVKLFRAIMLYAEIKDVFASKIFKRYAFSSNSLTRNMSWKMASLMPSKYMKKAIDDVISSFLEMDNLDYIFYPDMAIAVSNNNMTGMYSVIFQALMAKGYLELKQSNSDLKDSTLEFAQVMVNLNPDKASVDFLDYLNLVSAKNLIEVNISGINIETCNFILNFLNKNPPPISALTSNKFMILFHYAISLDENLAIKAMNLIGRFLPENANYIAVVLSRADMWIQQSYLMALENNFHRKHYFLIINLKKHSNKSHIIDMISEILKKNEI